MKKANKLMVLSLSSIVYDIVRQHKKLKEQIVTITERVQSIESDVATIIGVVNSSKQQLDAANVEIASLKAQIAAGQQVDLTALQANLDNIDSQLQTALGTQTATVVNSQPTAATTDTGADAGAQPQTGGEAVPTGDAGTTDTGAAPVDPNTPPAPAG